MSRVSQLVEEIGQLCQGGLNLLKVKEGETPDIPVLGVAYESWYTRALGVITQVIPERIEDFRQAYKLERRKEITPETYTISDYLMGLSIDRGGLQIFDTRAVFHIKVVRQIAILQAAKETAPSALRDIRTVLQSELIDNDLDGAKELLKANHLRAAGVVVGVALEAHLKAVATRRSITIKKKHPTLGDLNDELRKHGVYDVPMWRLLQRLADIRNLCGHSKDRDPTKPEVDDLIAGAEKVTKEVG
jgi:hypothetical protein